MKDKIHVVVDDGKVAKSAVFDSAQAAANSVRGHIEDIISNGTFGKGIKVWVESAKGGAPR